MGLGGEPPPLPLDETLHVDLSPVYTDPDPDWLRLHGGKLDSNPDSDHLSHVDCDPDSNPDSGPGARVNTALDNHGGVHACQLLLIQYNQSKE